MAEKKKHPSSEQDLHAAAQDEAAQAADYLDPGNPEEAKKHATSAQDHSQDADRHSKTAHYHSEK